MILCGVYNKELFIILLNVLKFCDKNLIADYYILNYFLKNALHVFKISVFLLALKTSVNQFREGKVHLHQKHQTFSTFSQN